MTTKIEGATGVDRVQDGVVVQADLADGVVGVGAFAIAYQNNPQAMPTNALAQMIPDVEEVDFFNSYNPTLERFAPAQAGYYLLTAELALAAASQPCEGILYKNDSTLCWHSNTSGSPFRTNLLIMDVVYLNGAGDYITISGKALNAGQSMGVVRFTATLVRAA